MALTSRDSFYHSPGEQISDGDTLRFANGDGWFYRITVRAVSDTDVTVTVRDDNTEDTGGTTIGQIILQNDKDVGEIRFKNGYYFDTGLVVDATNADIQLIAVEGRNEGADSAIA